MRGPTVHVGRYAGFVDRIVSASLLVKCGMTNDMVKSYNLESRGTSQGGVHSGQEYDGNTGEQICQEFQNRVEP